MGLTGVGEDRLQRTNVSQNSEEVVKPSTSKIDLVGEKAAFIFIVFCRSWASILETVTL